jgi:hypothetical protein
MLRGLPLSNELGWWSTHSGSSSPGSSSSGTSCAWGSCWSVQACSSGTATCDSSCDPVWCKCISKHANDASDYGGMLWWHDMQMSTWNEQFGYNYIFYKVVHVIKNMYPNMHLILLLVSISPTHTSDPKLPNLTNLTHPQHQQDILMLQRYTKHILLLLISHKE